MGLIGAIGAIVAIETIDFWWVKMLNFEDE